MTWNVVTLAKHTGDVRDYLFSYSNRGHALAKLRGLERRAYAAGKEIRYAIRRG